MMVTVDELTHLARNRRRAADVVERPARVSRISMAAAAHHQISENSSARSRAMPGRGAAHGTIPVPPESEPVSVIIQIIERAMQTVGTATAVRTALEEDVRMDQQAALTVGEGLAYRPAGCELPSVAEVVRPVRVIFSAFGPRLSGGPKPPNSPAGI